MCDGFLCRQAVCVGRVVSDVYNSATIVCITSKHLCIAGPYTPTHDLARKNAKFTVKLSATCHVVLGRCGELRRSNTVTVRFFKVSIGLASKLPILPVYMHLSYIHVYE